MLSKPLLALVACVASTTLALGCSSQNAPATAVAHTSGKTVDAATAGSLSGKVSFVGTPPPAETIRMGTDQACVQGAGPNPQSDAVLVAADGGLKNAFVYVKDGLDPAYSFDTPSSPALLDQKGCRYTPRVLGLRTGQPLRIVNSDPTLHNVHALPLANREFNKGTPTIGSNTTQTFTTPEVMVRFKCDVHGWMAAWVGVVAHPFFAVTDATGAFDIKGLPPGEYTIEAWHEKFGTRVAHVTIGDKQAQTVSFTFEPNPS